MENVGSIAVNCTLLFMYCYLLDNFPNKAFNCVFLKFNTLILSFNTHF
jgi:hypothetical protein